jgi:hypothetical protein
MKAAGRSMIALTIWPRSNRIGKHSVRDDGPACLQAFVTFLHLVNIITRIADRLYAFLVAEVLSCGSKHRE